MPGFSLGVDSPTQPIQPPAKEAADGCRDQVACQGQVLSCPGGSIYSLLSSRVAELLLPWQHLAGHGHPQYTVASTPHTFVLRHLGKEAALSPSC